MEISDTSGAWVVLVAAVSFPVYWILFAIFLPMKEKYLNWVKSKNWIWVNSIGFVSVILGVFSAIFIANFIGPSTFNYFATALVIVGAILMGSLLYFETYILPGLAATEPKLVDQSGPFYNSKSFIYIRNIGSFTIALGFVLWGVVWIQSGIVPLWQSLAVMIGAPLFAPVTMNGNVRLLGIFLYSAGLIGFGINMLG